MGRGEQDMGRCLKGKISFPDLPSIWKETDQGKFKNDNQVPYGQEKKATKKKKGTRKESVSFT